MIGEALTTGLSRNPDSLWQEIDLVNRRGLVVKFDEEGYRRASFLDHRAFIRETGPEGWLRVTVGTPGEMAAFRAALTEVLGL